MKNLTKKKKERKEISFPFGSLSANASNAFFQLFSQNIFKHSLNLEMASFILNVCFWVASANTNTDDANQFLRGTISFLAVFCYENQRLTNRCRPATESECVGPSESKIWEWKKRNTELFWANDSLKSYKVKWIK